MRDINKVSVNIVWWRKQNNQVSFCAVLVNVQVHVLRSTLIVWRDGINLKSRKTRFKGWHTTISRSSFARCASRSILNTYRGEVRHLSWCQYSCQKVNILFLRKWRWKIQVWYVLKTYQVKEFGWAGVMSVR